MRREDRNPSVSPAVIIDFVTRRRLLLGQQLEALGERAEAELAAIEEPVTAEEAAMAAAYDLLVALAEAAWNWRDPESLDELQAQLDVVRVHTRRVWN